jgi:hypothetical protein
MKKTPYGYIYCLTLLKDGRKYIGQTTGNPKKYYRDAYIYRKGEGRRYLASAIKKHTLEAFKFSVIAEAYSKKELDELEISYIKKYNCRCRGKGFNIKEGGSNGKHSKYSIKLMSESHKGLHIGDKSPVSLIATIRNTKSNREISGCMSTLAKRFGLSRESLSGRGKSKNWILVKLTRKTGEEIEIPTPPMNKGEYRGLAVANSKIATIRNSKSGKEDTGCASEMARKYGFNRDKILQIGKSKGWVLIKLMTKDGIECEIPHLAMDRADYRGLLTSNAKVASIKNIKTGHVETGCLTTMAKKYGFNRSHMANRRKSKDWVLLEYRKKDK